MLIKNLRVSVKAGPEDGLEEGQFTAYASVFGNVDSYGDVVAKGAFLDTLAEYKETGLPIPLYYGHNMSDPDFNLGTAEAMEDDHGLLVKATFDLENQKALQTYRLVKGRRINQMSFAFDVLDSGPTTVDGQKANELRKLKLYEVSVVPVGANQETEILAVKAMASGLLDGMKAGRVLSKSNETDLRTARDLIDSVLSKISEEPEEPDEDSGEKRRAPVPLVGDPPEGASIHKTSPNRGDTNEDGSANAPVKAEEPRGVKAEEPLRHTSLDSLEAIVNYLKEGS